MNIINRIKVKLYYKYANWSLKTESINLQESLINKKNIFIYFDYEREFGGNKTNINDENILQLLEILNNYEINTTWFAVGEILESYPETISKIQNSGHEIGSHTYSHIDLLNSSNKNIEKDFELYKSKISNEFSIKGFHPPKDNWTYNMIGTLVKYNFEYFVSRSNMQFSPKLVTGIGQRKIIKLPSLCDDWQCYVSNGSAVEIFNYYLENLKKIRSGDIAGIGFHPWILFSDKKIFEGFKQVISYLSNQIDVRLETATYYVSKLKIENPKT